MFVFPVIGSGIVVVLIGLLVEFKGMPSVLSLWFVCFVMNLLTPKK